MTVYCLTVYILLCLYRLFATIHPKETQVRFNVRVFPLA